MKNQCHWLLLSLLAAVLFTVTVSTVNAAPYASCITNNNGTITFYLNESGGNVVVTYGDGTICPQFDGTDTGTNLLSGSYSFSLGTESSYSIAVTKMGKGTAGIMPNVIQNTNGQTILTLVTNLFIQGDPRGVAVNMNPSSPYFGRIYVSRGGNSAGQQLFFDLNSDGTFSTAGPNGTNAGVTTWVAGSPYSSPDRISIAANDDLVVGDYSQNNAGVWLIDPNLGTNQLLLGPIGDVPGITAGIHGAEVATPIMLGDPATNATLFTIDGDLYTNRLEVYSNITYTGMASAGNGGGWQTVPNVTGPQVAVNLPENPNGPGYYFFPSLFVGANGYIYSGQYRSGTNGGLNTGDYAGVQVYGTKLTNQLFSSRYNGGKSDYFDTASAGGTTCLPTDLAVSPDGKYLATVGVDNHLTICVLTNGIPDVSSIYTVRPLNYGGEYADGANEVKWDLADNLYVLGADTFGLTTWTLGQSATCTTFGNASGTTNFTMLSLNPSVSVYATNNPVISQINSHGNPTNGTFTVVRSGGNIGQPLTVNFGYSGTATNGTYTAGSTGSVVFQPGQTVTNINIAAVSDAAPRLTIYLTITLNTSVNYTLLGNSATISILNAATPLLKAAAGLSSMYNAFSNDYCTVVITRLGDTNSTQTLTTYSLTGSAAEGTDYTAPTPVTFNPGDLTQTSYIYPLVGGAVPTHNPNLTYNGNKTVTFGLTAGSGYTVANTAALTILDSAYPQAQVLFADPLTNAADGTNWGVTAGDDNMSQVPSPDIDPQFGFNLYNAQNNPIPAPPNGATNALMITVNKSAGSGGTSPGTAVNLYFTNQVFGGNYAVRFNMNVIQGDCSSLEVGSYDPEEFALFGFNHSGVQTNLFFPGFGLDESYTNFSADGVFYSISDSGGRYDDLYTPYQGFIGNGSPTTNTGWAITGTAKPSSFTTQFKGNVFTCYASDAIPPNYNSGWTEGGPGLPVNGSQTLGLSMNSWSDVELKQVGKIESLWIDKTKITSYTNNTGLFTNGYIMLGYEDPYDGGETPDTAVYYSNLRVVALTAPAISGALAYSGSGKTFTFDFTSSDGDLTPSSFTILGSTNVLTGYKSVSAAITQLAVPGTEEFQAVVSKATNSIEFYRVQEN